MAHSQVGDPRTLIMAANRLTAIKRALDEQAERINSSRTLKIEINCGVDEVTVTVLDIFKYAHRPSTDPPRFHP